MNRGNINVALVSLGCPKNLVDSEYMADRMAKAGLCLVDDPAKAEVIIVNTCGFIESAKVEAIDTILAMAEYKTDKCKYLIVTGCLSQRYHGDMKKDLPEIDAILGVGAYGEIVNAIDTLYERDAATIAEVVPFCEVRRGHTTDHFVNFRTPSTGSFAYLKIAEGCSNTCAYCAIPGIRGHMISRPMEDITAEADNLLQQNVKELIIVAQDTTAYGVDLYKERKLPELLQKICALPYDFHIRLLYCYSDGMTEELLTVLADEPKIYHYIDMPIQHASDHVLKLMGRKDTKENIYRIMHTWRQRIPDIVFRTTVMVGFPGETEADFNELIQLIKDLRFERLGCFEFSPEEGTKAVRMPDQVPAEIAKQRYETLMEVQNKISQAFNESRLHTITTARIEGITEDGIFYLGRSYAESPDIDPMLYILAKQRELNPGEMVKVEIIEVDAYDITAVTCE